MVFKLIQEAQKNWRRLNEWKKLELIRAGRKFVDGVLQEGLVA
jgi:hypothetical protein